MKSITIQAPATVANLVCGFDILGLALESPADTMTMSLLNDPIVEIEHTDQFGLPTVPSENVCGVVLKKIMEATDHAFGFRVRIEKRIKPGSGLGSSAASSAGAAVGAHLLLDERFSKEELVHFATFGEELASGVRHADNVAPCIYGGITLIRSNNPLDIIPLASPDLYVAVVHPQIEIKTSDARKILRKNVELQTAIEQWGNVAGLVTGILQQDNQLISRSLQDKIIEPMRSILIPQYDQLKKDCLDAGALGGGISGSGPSVFMLCETRAIADKVSDIMHETYNKQSIQHFIYTSKINPNGITQTS